jgi:GGDEF domain-containing protein
VAAFTAAVGDETAAYIAGLDEAFKLTILDEARAPKNPIDANKRFTVILGGAFGLLLGVGLALIVEQLQWPAFDATRFSRTPRSADRFNIIDPETDVYNEAYLLMRYDQELARSRRSGPVCIGFMKMQARDAETKVAEEPSRRDLRAIVEAIQPTIRDEDLLAYLGSGSFAVMLPEVDPEYAGQLLENWAEDVAGPSADGRAWLEATVGVGSFGTEAVTGTGVLQELPRGVDEGDSVDEVVEDRADEMNAREVMLQILSTEDHG